MYEAHFGLTGPPFQLNPDSAFYFDSRVHGEALAYLKYGIAQRQGFIVLTGEIGAGKTTLVKTLIERLDPQAVRAAHVVSSQLEATDLLRAVLTGFGAPASGDSKADLVASLEVALKRLAAEHRTALLVIDEAQNLKADALEDLRLLSNLQDGNHSLLQIVLVGQPELRGLLHSPELAQLRQRIFASCHLGPLAPEDAKAYVEHRLGLVGWRGVPAISDAAHARIFESSGGLPRRINRLCNRLLVAAYLSEHEEISAKLVADTATALHAEIGDAVERPSGVAMEVDRAYMELVTHLRERGGLTDTRAPAPPPRAGAAPFTPRIDLPFLDEPRTHGEAVAESAPGPAIAYPLSLEPPPAHPVSLVDYQVPEPPRRRLRPLPILGLAAVAIAAVLAWQAERPVAPDERVVSVAPPAAPAPAAQTLPPPTALPELAPTSAGVPAGRAAVDAAAVLGLQAAAATAQAAAASDAAQPAQASVEPPVLLAALAPATPPPPRPAAAATRASAPRPPAQRPRAAPPAPHPALPAPVRNPPRGTAPRPYAGACTDTVAALGLCHRPAAND